MISLEHVDARAGKFRLADVTFTVPSGAYGVVIGPAGAGKTTLLETIAGVVPATAGRIMLGGRDATTLTPEARGVGIVYQHAYLFPHLTVRENVEYGAVDRPTADDLARRFGVDALRDRVPGSLSGGERQLVALARALARRPDIVLLDEPFSALDPRSRNAARRALRTLHEERRFTVLQVTHDFAEAGLLGDLAIVLDRGRIAQQGSPEAVFRRPSSPYLADFLGAENVFSGTIAAPPDDARGGAAAGSDVAGHDGRRERAVDFTTGALVVRGLSDRPPGAAHAVIRAEEIVLSAETPSSSMQNRFPGVVVELLPSGPLVRVTVDVAGTPVVAAVTARSARELDLVVGREIVASFKTTAVHLC